MLPVKYTGIDNLQIMEYAVKYNSFLVQEIIRYANKAKVAVDFGAGIGTFSQSLRQKGVQILCVEQDAQMQKLLRENGFEVVSDIRELPKQQVDYIYSLNVLEHIEDDWLIIQEFFRILRPGGRIYIYVPAFNILYSSMDKKVGHLRRYRYSNLKSLLIEAGFTIEYSRYVDSLGFFATLFFKVFGNKKGDLNICALKMYDKFLFPISCSLDGFLGRILGKNIAVTAIRPLNG
jgi:SAM-dependent methyltransferase